MRVVGHGQPSMGGDAWETGLAQSFEPHHILGSSLRVSIIVDLSSGLAFWKVTSAMLKSTTSALIRRRLHQATSVAEWPWCMVVQSHKSLGTLDPESHWSGARILYTTLSKGVGQSMRSVSQRGAKGGRWRLSFERQKIIVLVQTHQHTRYTR